MDAVSSAAKSPMFNADPNAEILRQLTRIADAASAPHPSAWTEWLKAIASFCAGLLLAYLTELVRHRSGDRDDQRRMRRIVYSELSRCFLELDSWVALAKAQNGVAFSVFKNLCPFDGETYMKENPAVFYGLSEGQILAWLYYRFHEVDGGGLQNPRTYHLVEMKAPLRFFGECYKRYPTLRKHFKKMVTPEDFAVIEHRVKHYEQDPPTLQEWVDSGLIKIVEKTQGTAAP